MFGTGNMVDTINRAEFNTDIAARTSLHVDDCHKLCLLFLAGAAAGASPTIATASTSFAVALAEAGLGAGEAGAAPGAAATVLSAPFRSQGGIDPGVASDIRF